MKYVKFHGVLNGAQSTGLCAVIPDRVWMWMCNGKVIGVAEGKQPLSRPTLLGHGLVKQYKPDTLMARATAQLQQVCGQLHHNCLKYGVLYTDECFWFLQYDQDSVEYSDTLCVRWYQGQPEATNSLHHVAVCGTPGATAC